MAVGRLYLFALDCADPEELVEFWSEMVGGEVVFRSSEFCGMRVEGMSLATVRVEGYRRPDWPGSDVLKQFHIDVSVEDLDAAEAAAVELGAAVAEDQPKPDRWRVLFDPAGHPFCVTIQGSQS